MKNGSLCYWSLVNKARIILEPCLLGNILTLLTILIPWFSLYRCTLWSKRCKVVPACRYNTGCSHITIGTESTGNLWKNRSQWWRPLFLKAPVPEMLKIVAFQPLSLKSQAVDTLGNHVVLIHAQGRDLQLFQKNTKNIKHKIMKTLNMSSFIIEESRFGILDLPSCQILTECC